MTKKILVVEEKPFMLRLIQHHLERAGFELIKARNRQEAINAIAQQSPELVVMDDSGRPLLHTPFAELSPKKTVIGLPVIRVTDSPDIFEEKNPTLDAEVVLAKPFSPTQLVSEVKRLVPGS